MEMEAPQQQQQSPPTMVPVADLVAASSDNALGFSRVMYLACATNGLRTLFTVDKKRTLRVPQIILRDSLKIDIDTMRAVQAVHDSVAQFQQLQRTLDTNSGGGLSREEAGLLLRGVREAWEEALWLACADELAQALGLAQYEKWLAHIARKDKEPADSVHSWSDILFDVALPEQAAALITKYGRLAAAIHSAGLHGSWNLKPLLVGNTLMKELPGLKKGPLMGQIMEAQLRWQLRMGPQGSVQDCTAYLAVVLEQQQQQQSSA